MICRLAAAFGFSISLFVAVFFLEQAHSSASVGGNPSATGFSAPDFTGQ